MNKEELSKIFYALQIAFGKEGIKLFSKILNLINWYTFFLKHFSNLIEDFSFDIFIL